jgi:hypothetical protein
MHRVFDQLLRAFVEVAALVQTLGVLQQGFDCEDAHTKQQQRRDVLVLELVALDVGAGHQEEDQLDVRLDHPLELNGVPFVVLLLLGELRVSHQLFALQNVERGTGRHGLRQVL